MPTLIAETNVNLIDVQLAIAVMARSGAAYASFGAGLRPEGLLQYATRAEAAVWAAVTAVYEGMDRPPRSVELRAEIQRFFAASAEELSDGTREKVGRMVRQIYDPEKFSKAYVESPKVRARVGSIVRAWETRVTQSDLRRVLARDGVGAGQFSADLESGIRQLGAAAAIGKSDFPSLFEGGLQVEAAGGITQETGCDIVDHFTGGLAAGEILLLVAPMGSCKTTVAIQVAASAAARAKVAYFRRVQDLAERGKKTSGVKKRVTLLFSSEQPRQDYSLRFLCHVAKIPLDRLKAIVRKEFEYDDSDVPAASPETEYERRVYPTGVGFRSERKRAAAAVALLDEYVWFFDVTGQTLPDGAEAPGKGGVREYAHLVETRLRLNPGCRPGMAVIDHLSAATEVYMGGRPASRDDPQYAKREFMKNFPRELRNRLLGKYGIPCLLTHQIAGAHADKPPTTVLSHTDAAECKMVAEYADVAIAAGNFTKGEPPNHTMFNMSKPRNRARKLPAVASLDGLFGYVGHAKDVVIDNREFVERDRGDPTFADSFDGQEGNVNHAAVNNLVQ